MGPCILLLDDNAELLGLLSRVFEEAGYRVVQAQRARMALEKAKTERPALAIVDVLLPDMMGFEVAGMLRQMDVPCILMSGVFKGGRHALDAVQRQGVLAYFEKPFQTDRLLEKVASVVPAGPRPDEGSSREAEPHAWVDHGDEDEQSLELTGRISVTEAAGNVSATLKGDPIRVPAIRRERIPTPPPPPRPAAPPVLQPVGGSAGVTAPVPAPAAPAQMGQLRDNLPQLISAFYLAQETGELLVQRGAVRKAVYFEKGAPVFAGSNLSTDRFGQFLVRIGKVPAEDLAAAALVAERTRRRTGDVLIEMGLLSDAERMYYVAQQVKAIIYSLFAWEEGVWQITFRNRAQHEVLKLDLHPANLIMRGVRKLYSPQRLERLLPDGARPSPSQEPSYLLSDVELEAWEAHLLARIDGTRSVADLTRLAQKEPHLVRGVLAGLCALKILEISRER